MNSMYTRYPVHCLAYCPIHVLNVFILYLNIIGHFTSSIVNIMKLFTKMKSLKQDINKWVFSTELPYPSKWLTGLSGCKWIRMRGHIRPCWSRILKGVVECHREDMKTNFGITKLSSTLSRWALIKCTFRYCSWDEEDVCTSTGWPEDSISLNSWLILVKKNWMHLFTTDLFCSREMDVFTWHSGIL